MRPQALHSGQDATVRRSRNHALPAVLLVALRAAMLNHRRMSSSALAVRRALESDAHALASIHVTAWHETYTGLLPSEMLSRLDVADRAERWASVIADFSQENSGSAFLAVEPDGATGFVSVGKQRDQALADRGYSAEITAIYVLKAAQRKGVGRALLREAAAHLRRSGHNAAALWVLEKNAKARRFYEALGSRPVAERQEVRPEAVLSEVAYGWDDLTPLLE